METYIIKPLKTEETASVKHFSEKFAQTKKLHICSGAEKVGKTALSIKLVHCLVKENTGIKPIFISLDDTAAYWQNKIEEYTKVIIFRYHYKEKTSLTLQDILNILKSELLQKQNNFVVVDGIDKHKGASSQDDFESLLIYLVGFVKEKQLNVFITTRKSGIPLAHPFLKKAQQDNLIKQWSLERAEYLGGDIKEFGDTRLKIGCIESS